jgi:hypothetical protein
MPSRLSAHKDYHKVILISPRVSNWPQFKVSVVNLNATFSVYGVVPHYFSVGSVCVGHQAAQNFYAAYQFTRSKRYTP